MNRRSLAVCVASKSLGLLAALVALVIPHIQAVTSKPEPAVVSDPNFPLIQLPAKFDSHRATKRVNLGPGESYDLLKVAGPGCVRHMWITATAPERLDLEVACDGVEEPQVKMQMNEFFGVLLGQQPYRIESAPIKLLPKSGFNSYFPMPFESSCRIVLRNNSQEKVSVWSMADWQQYGAEVKITPYRLNAVCTKVEQAGPFDSVLLGSIAGGGFVAGMIHAIKRHDQADMIWHTGGDTWLIDGETNPHVLRGIGSEDVFGYSFGVYKDLSQWMGGAHAVGENQNCSEIVAYRFFGIDSVAFKSSLVLRFGTRANHVENVLYYYRDIGAKGKTVESPKEWTLSGPFEVTDYARFREEPLPVEVADEKPGKWDWGNRILETVRMTPEHTWVDFSRWYRFNKVGNTGTQPDRCAAYASAEIVSKKAGKAVLRLGFDDWAKVWLNGVAVATLRHDDGVRSAEIPVALKAGSNRLVVRLSNFDNVEWRCWAFSCAVMKPE